MDIIFIRHGIRMFNNMGDIKIKSVHDNMNTRQLKLAYRELLSKYRELLVFVKELADESVYEKYENENHISWAATELLQEIKEL